MEKTLYWTPRILGITFVMLTVVLAMDSFQVGYSFWRAMVTFSIHLIPSYIMIAALLLAWWREWLGGIIFASFSVIYATLGWQRFPLSTIALISGLLAFIGLLFLSHWFYRLHHTR